MRLILNKFVSISLVTAAIAGCVRHRPVEQKRDFDGDRWEKATFANGQEWLGTVTIVNNGSNTAFGMVGAQAETRIGHFNITKDKLQFLASDNYVNPQSNENRLVNEWAITHSEYHQKVSGGRVSNVETENDDISWKDKKFFKVDWSSATISEATSFPFEIDGSCWSKKNSRVDTDSTDIGADHINFTVVVTYELNMDNYYCLSSQAYAKDLNTNTVEYKYSFMPDFKSDYKPYVYTGENDPLMKKYGYFQTVTSKTDQYNRTKNIFMMNRWNTGKTHTFYFAKGFPEEYKWIYNAPKIGVIARTNQLFEDNKVPLHFEVKDADDQHQFGDIRYSFFNFIDDQDDSAPLGYGPSVAHPRTGEIISANSTIWTSLLKYYVKRIRDHANRLPEYDKSSSLYVKMTELLGKPSDQWSTASSTFLDNVDAANAFRYAIPDYTYGRQGSLYSADGHASSITNFKALPKVSSATADSEAFKALGKIEENIATAERREGNMSDLQRFKKSQVRYLDAEGLTGLATVIPEMSDDDIINDILYRVAIHEFGHNMNLRHNFYGSVDAAMERGHKTEKHGLKYASTSVMDYLDLKDELDQVQDWEPYDKAALLFSYSSGALDETKTSGRVHLFCTDEHLSSNPLCNHFDSGATPTEVLKSLIAGYDENYYRRNFRDDRAFWDTSAYAGGIVRTMIAAKKFLNLQKYAYKPEELQSILGGLSTLTPEGKDLFIKGIQTDMTEAVKLSMAFYAAVIAQSSNDRPFTEVYDSWNGSLKYQGIFPDKIYASRFLLAADGIAFNPNQGPYLTSFSELLESPDAQLQQFTKKIMSDIYSETGDGYVGYSTLVRTFAMVGTAYQKGSDVAYEATRFGCYTADTLKTRFGVDTSKSFKDQPLLLVDDMTQVKDPYYSNQTKVAILQIDGRFYTAGADANFLAYGLLNKSGISASDKADIRELYATFYLYSEGRTAECQ